MLRDIIFENEYILLELAKLPSFMKGDTQVNSCRRRLGPLDNPK